MPRVFGYLRCSGERQASEGHTIDAQLVSVATYAKLLIESNEGVRWTNRRFPENMPAGFFVDLAVSAWKHPLPARKAFAALLSHVKSGDHIVVSRLDRAFRNVQDFSNSLALMAERGITIHFAEQQINFGTANGRAMAQMLAVFAEWESSMRSERLRAAWRELQAKRGKEVDYSTRRTRAARRCWKTREFTIPVPSTARQIQKDGAAIRPGKVYGYVRISHFDGVKSGFGLEAQRRALKGYRAFLAQKPRFAHLAEGETFNDEAVSAWKEPLRERAAGRKLDALLQEGDHVIFGRLDRAFRSMKDFAATHEEWKRRGITMHFADQQLDMSSPAGVAMGGLLAVFAQWESMAKSERNKAVVDSLRSKGRRYCNDTPALTKVLKNPQGQHIIPDRKAMVIARYGYLLRKRDGMSYRKISDRVEAILAKREGRPIIREAGQYVGRGKWIHRPYHFQWFAAMVDRMDENILLYGDPFVVPQMPPHHPLSIERRRKK